MGMNMNLFEMVRDQHGAAATNFLGELLQKQPEQLRGEVDSSIGTVLDGFSTVAKDQGGRELLYEAIRYCDDSVVEDPAVMFRDRDSREVFTEANNRLASLVGISNKNQMVETLQARANLPQADAENMLGYIAPGVMGVLKRQIGKGEVLDNPDGIGQMFLGEGDIAAVDTTRRSAHAGGGHTGASAAAAVAHDEGGDHSWIFRYALPALLLGGLVLGGLNNCSNRAENEIIAAEQNKLQLELDGVREENLAAKSQIETLQGDFDIARQQTADLTARADGLTVELDAAKTRVVELEGELETAKADGEAAMLEIEAAKAEAADLNAQADSLNAELDAARTRVEGLQGDLTTAQAESTDLSGQVQLITAELNRVKDLPTETSELQGLLSTVTDERDASIDATAVVQGQLDTVIQERDSAMSQVAELQTNLDEATASIAMKDEELGKVDALRAELDQVTIGRDDALTRNVEYKTANADLQQQLDSTTRQVTDLETRLRGSTEKVSLLDGNLASTTQMLEEEKSSRAADINRLTGESTDLQSQLANMLGMRDEAVNTLSMRDSEITSLGEKVNSLQDEVRTLEEANAKAREEAAMLQEQIDGLTGELEVTQGKVEEAGATLTEREASLAAVNTDLDTAKADIEALTTERDELMNKRDALASRVKELMEEKDAVVAETVDLTGQIDGLTAELDAAKQAGVESDNKMGLLNDSMSGLQKELKLITGARDEASEQAKTFRAEAADLKQKITTLETDLASAQAAHDEALAAMQQERDSVASEL
jgi:chromosome segregation ATPase